MFKKGIIWLHKWLGLFSGIIVFILSITGCIYVFQDELKLLVYPERYYIQEPVSSSEALPVSELLKIAQQAISSNEKISRLDLFPAKDRTWIFRAAQTNEHAFGHWNYQKYYKRVFVNPYSGEVQAVENTKYEFFQIVLQLHLNLLLGKKVGHALVGASTILFTVLLLSGIVLWWPKKWKRKPIKRGLTLSFNVKWKRLIYDLHNVLGFYSLLIALIFAITGLVFAYPKFKEGYINAFNFVDRSMLDASAKVIPQVKLHALDDALAYTLRKHPSADMMSLRLKANGDKQDIQVRLQKDKTSDFVWYYFNLKDGHIVDVKMDETNRLGDQIAAMNYDLHVGNIYGIGTKFLYFFMSLICASLPVTGFMMWVNKTKKKNRSVIKNN
ncbi:MAG: PepSY-associated TM helix domain-containing protein [Sphingobacterium sp.]